jgi:ankyrin repeat protein
METSAIPTLIQSGKNEELRALLDQQPHLAEGITEQGISYLLFAAYCRNTFAVEIIRALREELTAFEAAAIGDYSRLVDLLKTNPNLINQPASDGFSLLGLATFFGQQEVVQLLLDSGAAVNQHSQNTMRVAPLHSAVAIGSIELVKILLDHGAQIDAPQQNGITALHAAAHHGNTELVQLLLKQGADSSLQTSEGKTALDFAKEDGHQDIIQFLEQ